MVLALHITRCGVPAREEARVTRYMALLILERSGKPARLAAYIIRVIKKFEKPRRLVALLSHQNIHVLPCSFRPLLPPRWGLVFRMLYLYYDSVHAKSSFLGTFALCGIPIHELQSYG